MRAKLKNYNLYLTPAENNSDIQGKDLPRFKKARIK